MVNVSCLMFVFILALDTASSHVYKLVNSSVQLDTKVKNVQFNEFKWMINKTFILKFAKDINLIYKFNGYKDRVEFDNETMSLTVKNLQKSDSGLYEAKAEATGEKIVANYTLRVLDPVKKPEITSVHEQTNKTCTITCRSETLSVNSRCLNGTCGEANEASLKDARLSVYANSSHIICNNSNPVSWKTTFREIKQLCSTKHETENSSSSLIQWAIPITCLFLIGICVLSILPFIVTHKTTAEPPSNTVYEEVQISNIANSTENPPQMSENREGPSTVYATIGKPKTSNPNLEVQCPPGQE